MKGVNHLQWLRWYKDTGASLWTLLQVCLVAYGLAEVYKDVIESSLKGGLQKIVCGQQGWGHLGVALWMYSVSVIHCFMFDFGFSLCGSGQPQTGITDMCHQAQL